MKKLYIAALALVLVSPLASVYAKNGADDTHPDDNKERAGFFFRMNDERKEALKERNDLMKEKMEEHREVMQEKREDFRREHAHVFIERIKAHFEWAIKWVENIYDRALAHLEKLQDETDRDLSDAEAYLDDAKTEIAAAWDALNDIKVPDSSDDDKITDDEDTAKVAAVREQFAEVKTHIKAAHEALRNVVKSMKK